MDTMTKEIQKSATGLRRTVPKRKYGDQEELRQFGLIA